MSERAVSIVDVGPRDGFQAIAAFIPTATKIDMIARLHAAGVRRVEATAFVSDKAVPQMADAAEILAASRDLPGLDVQVLTPNVRYAEKAIGAGARHIAFVLSVSEKHNLNNVRRLPADSAAEYATLAKTVGDQTRIRLNVATAFDCPFDGPLAPEQTLALLEHLVESSPDAEVALCDTTGRVTPDRVRSLFETAMTRLPLVSRWAFHGHDTYGLGVANVLAAYDAGVRVFDASFAGLGGCPFAPGATGNVATEDVVWTFEQMGVRTGIDVAALISVARDGAALPDACSGGRVRQAVLMAQARETG
ncbi:hydroxymethylglutaryl-CoA lyase [Terricaulis silvestris]|uniref:Hydroxymethylglutaryl-CoA lyase YngG n=1 Tax=Terricaulis silvestris TaxID=2686094 RepID=A0A6I6MKN3_9CAUL|nr:hydroxymethylglutaryl-CoA lyase [Terricaulis silvestris]QGZ93788.1 Hydroxymethylglutaryl-CoA lyase YngG [Terricaulis silvestris]